MKPIPYERRAPSPGEPFFDIIVTADDWGRFGSDLIATPVTGGAIPSKADVLAVILDLEGFTRFCSQRDPHRIIPRFVHEFREWLFAELKSGLQDLGGSPQPRLSENELALCAPPPFFAKFLGDGFLFLWPADHDELGRDLPTDLGQADVARELDGDLTNVLSVLVDIVRRYTHFVDDALHRYTNVPPRLRCGAAVGVTCAIDNGLDYVGACINQASRLQKLGPLGFAVDSVGLPATFANDAPLLERGFIQKTIAVRGAGQTRAFLLREEWDRLDDAGRAMVTAQ